MSIAHVHKQATHLVSNIVSHELLRGVDLDRDVVRRGLTQIISQKISNSSHLLAREVITFWVVVFFAPWSDMDMSSSVLSPRIIRRAFRVARRELQYT